ncbi:MAG TPA: SCO family protein [Leptolinea sp.]
MQSPKLAYNFNLIGPGAKPLHLNDFNGKVVLLVFGYTACPDDCPTTLNKLHEVIELAGHHADGIQVIMITVDPEKDTPDKINRYASSFHPSFIGLTGKLEDIQTTGLQYNVFFQKHPYNNIDGYLVDHTATISLIDPDGFLRVVYPQDVTAKTIADDCIYILSR